MIVDAQTGAVTLTGGFVFSPSTTRMQFEAARLHDPARVTNPGTPWFYFPFQDGTVEGKYLGVTPCFYKEALISMNFGVWPLAEGERGWSNYSLEAEEQAQRSQLQMLQTWFGPPHTRAPSGLQEAGFPLLQKTVSYNFVWGQAWSGFDQRGGFVSAGLRHSRSDAWARADYEQERPRQKRSKPARGRWFRKPQQQVLAGPAPHAAATSQPRARAASSSAHYG